MSKKSGTIIKIVAFAAGVAAVGAACYVYRDKIKEFAEKNDVKGKVNHAKNFVTDKLQRNKNQEDFDDAEFFDELEEEDSSSRGYTSITITSDEAPTDKASEIKDALTEKAEDAKESITEKAEVLKETIADKTEDLKKAASEKAEAISAAVKEESPEEYEYEGLSDVSEDEDVLADEAAIDGV